MKQILFFIAIFLALDVHADGGNQCSAIFKDKVEVARAEPHFENGHNTPLRNVMLKMKEYEDSIREFVDALTVKPQSPYLKDTSAQFRTPEALAEVLEVVHKYERVLSHLVEHSEHMMMSPRIQMIPAEKRAAFIAGYQQSYVNYLATFHRLIENLESMEGKDPATWNNQVAKGILMELHTQMGAAHNKF